MDILNVAETVKQLAQKQGQLLEGFDNGNKQLIQSVTDLRETKNDIIRTINGNFDAVRDRNKKSVSAIEETTLTGVNSIRQEGKAYREAHDKLLVALREQGIVLNRSNDINLEKLRQETAKVSQLEQQVLTLIEENKSQFEHNILALNKATIKVDNSSQAIVELAATAISAGTVLKETLDNSLINIDENVKKSLSTLQASIAENIEDVKRELNNGHKRLVETGDSLNNSITDSLNDLKKKTDATFINLRDSIISNVEYIKKELGDANKQSAYAAKLADANLTKILEGGLDRIIKENNDAFGLLKSSITRAIQNVKDELSFGLNKLADSTEAIITILTKSRDDNRQFYADFERLLRIKLDENKGEIKQLIEYEREQVRSILNYSLKITEEKIQDNIKLQIDSVAKQQQRTLWMLGGILVAIVALAIVVWTKL